MNTTIGTDYAERNRFESISDFDYLKDGVRYNVLDHEKVEDVEGLWGDTADEILEYIVGGDRLRDVITQVKVIDRTI